MMICFTEKFYLQLFTKNKSLDKITDVYRTRVAREDSVFGTGPSLGAHNRGIVVLFQAERKKILFTRCSYRLWSISNHLVNGKSAPFSLRYSGWCVKLTTYLFLLVILSLRMDGTLALVYLYSFVVCTRAVLLLFTFTDVGTTSLPYLYVPYYLLKDLCISYSRGSRFGTTNLNVFHLKCLGSCYKGALLCTKASYNIILPQTLCNIAVMLILTQDSLFFGML